MLEWILVYVHSTKVKIYFINEAPENLNLHDPKR